MITMPDLVFLSNPIWTNALSVIAIIISVKVYAKNKLYSSAQIEQTLRASIDGANAVVRQTRQTQQDYDILKKAPGMEFNANQILQSAISSYLNAVNQGCQFYFFGQIRKQSFKDQFAGDVKSAYELVTELTKSRYRFIVRYYDKHLRS
jgi:hypothetical protein